jgi:hypothetical protein
LFWRWPLDPSGDVPTFPQIFCLQGELLRQQLQTANRLRESDATAAADAYAAAETRLQGMEERLAGSTAALQQERADRRTDATSSADERRSAQVKGRQTRLGVESRPESTCYGYTAYIIG